MVHVNKMRTVFPAAPSEAQQIKLKCLDLQMLSVQYVVKAFVYRTPANDFSSRVEHLAEMLSKILVKFNPLAGRLTTNPVDGWIYILCNDWGVDFIEATAEELSIADFTAAEVTPAGEQLLALNGALNFEGHRLPLLRIQVTQLRDGVAVCFTINHAVADGVSITNFLSAWSHLCRTNGNWNRFPVDAIFGRGLLHPGRSVTGVTLGFNPGGHVQRPPRSSLRFKKFHFSTHTINRLKERANQESSIMISSYQALCAHVWRAVSRARGLSPHEPTTCNVAVDCRARLLPTLPNSYFGNVIQNVSTTTTCGKLVSSSLSFSAGFLKGVIAGHTNKVIRERIDKWRMQPLGKNCLVVAGSPQFQTYETDFGWGEPVAVRSGLAYPFDGMMYAYSGPESGASVEIELCFPSSVMAALESDPEFICPPLIQSKI